MKETTKIELRNHAMSDQAAANLEGDSVSNKKDELPAGCKGCQSTLPCEYTCGADPFVERGKSPQAGSEAVSAELALLNAARRLKKATHAAERNFTLIAQNNGTPGASRIMREYTAATKALFEMV